MNKPSFPSLDDIKKHIHLNDETGQIWLDDQRMLLLHSASFSALRDELLASLGEFRAKGLMWRMGYASGVADAHLARKIRPHMTDEEAFAVGPQLHAVEGIVRVEPIYLDMDIDEGRFQGEFYWDNSYEAEEHIKVHGIHSEPVCWAQLGYASGYSSEFMSKDVFFKEVQCVGCGDKRCKIVGKLLTQWEDSDELQRFYQADPVAEQLLSLKDEVQKLRSEINDVGQINKIICESPAIKQVLPVLDKAAQTDVSVLMLGETGVGKEVFSFYLHANGPRADKPFVVVNCGALPKDLIEAELFGVEKGAYTGADKSRPGRFERAHGGTLFLDEVGELSKEAQVKLLRVLQSGDFERVGDTRSRKVDVRILAATNVPLEERIADGAFRADLFYRLNVFPVTIPPLRERLADINGLVEKFLYKYSLKHDKKITGVSASLMDSFMDYHWPGNIRELQNIIERGVILTNNGFDIDVGSVSMSKAKRVSNIENIKAEQVNQQSPVDAVISSGISFDELEEKVIRKALLNTDGNISAAARNLGMTAPQLRYRLKKFDSSS